MNKLSEIKLDGLERFATSFRADFRFAPLNIMVLVILSMAGMAIHFAIRGFSLDVVTSMVLTAIGMALLFKCLQIWEAVLVVTTAAAFMIFMLHRPQAWILVAAVIVAGLVSPCIQMAYQWERAVVLRFGRFRGLRGSGLFAVFPVIDKVANYVDQRIRVTDFKAETTLTRDTVPVNVDAIAFWMIWNPKKAILELETFMDAVILSAQTALRDAIGKHELATLLSERDRLGKEIQEILEAKTSAWGITILSIEIRDIIIPKELEDAMSKRAQAERERQSRVILGTAEVEIAEKFEKAAERYKHNPTALHLRAMNMLYEGLKKNGSIVLVPSNALETMSLGTVLGTTALEKVEQMNQQEKEAPHGQD